jgi:hypothetical protein
VHQGLSIEGQSQRRPWHHFVGYIKKVKNMTGGILAWSDDLDPKHVSR